MAATRPRAGLNSRKGVHRPIPASGSARSARPCRSSWACKVWVQMADAELGASGPEGVLVPAAVVRHHPVDAHPQAGMVGHGVAQELHATRSGFVGLDTGKGHPRMVVDGQVHGVPADAPIAVRALAGDAVPDAVDPPQALGVDVQQLARRCPFVAHDWFHRIKRFQARRPDPSQMATDRGQAVPRLGGDPPLRPTLAP